ncbi:MAG: CopD family protein [Ottowia sp.]|nr:CopD family protein [Ottowia sp.]
MLLIKTFHLLFVISWFAGLFYLPRLFVNLALDIDGAVQKRLLIMAHKLYRFMTVLAFFALVLGLWLWGVYGIGSGQAWLHIKLVLVVLLLGYHHGCGVLLKKFSQGRNTHTHRWYRWFNEVPVVMLLLVLLLVIFKPF